MELSGQMLRSHHLRLYSNTHRTFKEFSITVCTLYSHDDKLETAGYKIKGKLITSSLVESET